MVKGKWVKTDGWCALRQRGPQYFDKRSFRTVSPNVATRIVVGCKKGHWHPSRRKGKQCDTGLEMQSFRKRKVGNKCPRRTGRYRR